MITKLRKAQDTWAAKAILVLTALSFMSLFGISGYLNSAADNRAVIKVNDRVMTQADINLQLDKEIRTAQKIFGDFEVSDEIRNKMLAGIVERNLNSMITEETADKFNISISDDLVRSMIFSQPQFLDENGQFSKEQLNYFLSQSNLSEQQYIALLRKELDSRFLVQNPITGYNTPSALVKYVAAAEAQQKVFKYIELNDSDAVIDRDISEDEVNQYYSDFAPEFVEPERRDVDFLTISMNDIAKQIDISDEEIDEYYKNNLSQFVTPETRNVLQMVFDSKEKAVEAKKALDKGEDFYKIAKEMANQTEEETDLDYVSEDMLIGDTGTQVFALAVNDITEPMQSELGWHIMKVTDIKAGAKEDEQKVKKQIAETLANEQVYEVAYDTINQIEDKIGAGSSLADIAQEMGVKIGQIAGLSEFGDAVSVNEDYAALAKNTDFIDTVFSYNQNEISQALETEDGFVFVKVNKITDSHPQDLKTALPKIKKMWRENEKAAITQELINDVMHDLENGDNMDEVASRYKLKTITTSPLTRSQNFADLSQAQMIELFNEPNGTPKHIDIENQHIIAVADGDYKAKELSETDMNILEQRLKLDLGQEAAAALINSYGEDYDVRVKYRLLGLTD